MQALCRACVPDSRQIQQLPTEITTLVNKLVEKLSALVDPEDELSVTIAGENSVC